MTERCIICRKDFANARALRVHQHTCVRRATESIGRRKNGVRIHGSGGRTYRTTQELSLAQAGPSPSVQDTTTQMDVDDELGGQVSRQGGFFVVDSDDYNVYDRSQTGLQMRRFLNHLNENRAPFLAHQREQDAVHDYQNGSRISYRIHQHLFHRSLYHPRQPVVPTHNPASQPTPSPSPEPEVPPDLPVETKPNAMGLYRIYPARPSLDPEEALSLDDLCDAPTLATTENMESNSSKSGFSNVISSIGNPFAPFLNGTTFRLMNWFYGPTKTKSVADLDRLVNDVMLHEDFKPSDLKGFNATKEMNRLDTYEADSDRSFSAFDDWKESSVYIPLPCERVKHKTEADVPKLEVKGLMHRSITSIVTSAFQDDSGLEFHMKPFKQMWKPSPDEAAVRIHGELYTSDAFLDVDKEIRDAPREPGCNLETAVAAIMLWSDSTHLASFGTASLWPIYMFFGNQSKYTRGKPTSSACHHLAYIPSVSLWCSPLRQGSYCLFQLPDIIQDVYAEIYGKTATATVLTQCKRELMHAIWLLLLDEEFMHAYVHGIVILCADGILRRIFPRFFTYSADYPEK
jgi:hypothetical protein